MKKNFLMVASLLIAAMLMVVSCSQEVAPKTENNGLVEARLNVAYGRDLTVSGDTKQNGITLKYTMTPSWNSGNKLGEEEIYGKVTASDNKTLAYDGSLGYVTPGLWTITVDAYGNDEGKTTSKKFFTGTANVYFNDTTQSATVFLAPIETENNSVTFDFKMQDLSDNMDADYLLTYNIYNGIDNNTPVASGNLTGSTTVDTPANVRKYTEESTIGALAGGFYRVNVSIYRKGATTAGNKLVGGTTKGFLVSGGANVTISGNIEPSDYENVSIDAYYVDVNTEFKTGNVMKGETDTGKDYGVSVNDTENGGAKVTMGITDNTQQNPSISGSYTVTYLWTAVSDGEILTAETNLSEVEFEFNSPGYKNISCTTVYSITGRSTGGSSSTYYFADTISTRVPVSPQGFTVKPKTSSSN